MSELHLNPVFTSAGLAALAAAHGQGVALKISHLAIGDSGYQIRDINGIPLETSRAMTALQSEQLRVDFSGGGSLDPQQVLMTGEILGGQPEFWIKELGFVSEDGTLVAVWSDTSPLGYRGATTWLFRFVLAWSDAAPSNIEVVYDGESTLSFLSLDHERLEAKVRHAVAASGQVWSDIDASQLTAAIPLLAPPFSIPPLASAGSAHDWDLLVIHDGDAHKKITLTDLLTGRAGRDNTARRMAALAYIQWMRIASDPACAYSEAVTDDFHTNNQTLVNGTYDSTNHLYSFPAPTKTIFDATGADQTYTVPAGVSKIRVKMWGAGGGGGYCGAATGGGGGGGYVEGDLDVMPGETLTIIVGKGGQNNTTAAYGGGGRGGIGSGNLSGGGGGRSAIRRSSNELATSGGGGGAYSSKIGGAGGGQIGGTSSADSVDGKGGTQSAGGGGGTGNTGNGNSGSQYSGGHGFALPNGQAAAGGGGGWYGGGSAGGAWSPFVAGAGGGGSSYVGGLTGSIINTQANGASAAAQSDTDRGGAGTGGPVTIASGAGSDGRIVIMPYGVAGEAASLISPSYTLPRQATDITVYAIVNDLEAVNEGIDRVLEVSCDGGSNWVAAIADTSRGGFGLAERLIVYEADVSAHSGTSFKWRLSAPTGKQMEIKLIAAFVAS